MHTAGHQGALSTRGVKILENKPGGQRSLFCGLAMVKTADVTFFYGGYFWLNVTITFANSRLFELR